MKELRITNVDEKTITKLQEAATLLSGIPMSMYVKHLITKDLNEKLPEITRIKTNNKLHDDI